MNFCNDISCFYKNLFKRVYFCLNSVTLDCYTRCILCDGHLLCFFHLIFIVLFLYLFLIFRSLFWLFYFSIFGSLFWLFYFSIFNFFYLNNRGILKRVLICSLFHDVLKSFVFTLVFHV